MLRRCSGVSATHVKWSEGVCDRQAQAVVDSGCYTGASRFASRWRCIEKELHQSHPAKRYTSGICPNLCGSSKDGIAVQLPSRRACSAAVDAVATWAHLACKHACYTRTMGQASWKAKRSAQGRKGWGRPSSYTGTRIAVWLTASSFSRNHIMCLFAISILSCKHAQLACCKSLMNTECARILIATRHMCSTSLHYQNVSSLKVSKPAVKIQAELILAFTYSCWHKQTCDCPTNE